MSEHLEAYYGLPEEVKFCKRCVISNQRPSSVVEFKNRGTEKKPTIEFDDQGICSACTFADMKETVIDWKAREAELIELCNRHRSKDGGYDCIVPGSGGKDSAFTAHILKYKYGMNPLTVTWAPHKYTEIGWHNFQNWIHSGLDNILYTPNGKLHRLLTRLAFENLVHPFQPFIIGQRLIGPRFSGLYRIPLVFYGENQAEYGNNIKENDRPTMAPSFYETTRDLDSLFLGGVSARDLISQYQVDPRDLNPYLPIDGSVLREVGTEVHYLGYYLKWDPQECYYYASEHTGFQVNVERTEGSYSKYSSIDDRIDPLHYYTTFIKFGIGRATYDAAQEVRNQKITREEAVALVKRYDAEFPSKYFHEILEYMGITEERFWEVIDQARSPHLWEQVNGEWRLRHHVY
ncbi:N-acetyl sugar amidotransferase [Geomonas paludis]|uniref:LPS biosynthesis protein PseA n=1 Tax=Geomonas paludis TaxID=2740185 RepID=A0A6V8N1W0_9BACT|nr:N-acetyl sugar amidotransferase [Geomonas paludis]UPU36494.1 N-acetyl sugar amidotransferase [Geomonas paludis]GFO65329.1 LPS biosynthesis protein PseA [Geomonas paludis]